MFLFRVDMTNKNKKMHFSDEKKICSRCGVKVSCINKTEQKKGTDSTMKIQST